ncbi:MAG: tetratricopeptide repeat protein [bacterium]
MKRKTLLLLFGVSVLILSQVSCQQNTRKKTQQEQSVDSLDLLTGQIREDSANYRLFLSRSRLYLDAGAVNPAFREINSALSLNKEDPEVYSMLADIYFVIGKSDDAIGALNKALELAPDRVSYVVKLARTHMMLRNYDLAYRYIERALAMDFQNAEAYYLKGLYLLEQKDTLGAITHMKIAGNYDTTFYETYMHTASLLNKLNDTSSIEYYQAALEARPDDEQALFLMGLTYQDQGRFENALECYERLMAVDPGLKQVHYNMGYIYLVEYADFQKAEASFRQAILIDPGYVDAVYNLGRTFEAMGQYEEARRQYRMTLEIRTNYDLAIEGLNRLDRLQQ